ncbi:hypothetical protein [Methylobacterium haplocladii]|uniref:Uncharacterized protein n=1 Tax=Methylobacterium haplocladii TaxID=1176176 RepID=A0A512IUW5_9HYPH|nr:hypothetical protein [Methylobacterium haplocladii]GEP01508.1 hypothetical protein MHA02_38950 [Methylobacterium haplocladii]GJD82307.1 hypothetical protein HPGCJGGD_0159 [Methylobacterium haplocladii]GLS59159.1 hypothetical protein GCM10007887_18250 [Methylobacterium haplocladii]
MNPFRLTDADVVVIDGIRLKPTALLEDGILLRSDIVSSPNPFGWDELMSLWLEKRMRIVPASC